MLYCLVFVICVQAVITIACAEYTSMYLSVKFIKHNQNYYLKLDLYQRPLSEEAGTQFCRFLIRREDAVSKKRSYVHVAQLVAALITVHGLLSFLSDVWASLIHLVKRSDSLSITVA